MAYQPAGERNPLPLNRLVECNIETETGHKASVLGSRDDDNNDGDDKYFRNTNYRYQRYVIFYPKTNISLEYRS